MVVQATLRKTMFKDVDQELSIGIARKLPNGKAIGASNDDRDMLIQYPTLFCSVRSGCSHDLVELWGITHSSSRGAFDVNRSFPMT